MTPASLHLLEEFSPEFSPEAGLPETPPNQAKGATKTAARDLFMVVYRVVRLLLVFLRGGGGVVVGVGICKFVMRRSLQKPC